MGEALSISVERSLVSRLKRRVSISLQNIFMLLLRDGPQFLATGAPVLDGAALTSFGVQSLDGDQGSFSALRQPNSSNKLGRWRRFQSVVRLRE
jgi:hypothetical protein